MGFSAAPIAIFGPVHAATALPAPSETPDLPLEIAFLTGMLSLDVLRLAARMAEEIGTTAEIVLLNEGLLASDDYYRRLAQHLALPFAEQPLRPAAGATIDTVLLAGIAPLRNNAAGWRFLAAPRGAALRRFMQIAAIRPRIAPPVIAVTSPERIEALFRHDRRNEVVQAASHGLSDWNAALSARAGVLPSQAVSLVGLACLFCVAAWVTPGLCLLAIEAVFLLGFLAVVVLRLLATAASPTPSPRGGAARVPPRDLPIYTVIVPLFRESAVIRRLVSSLDRLDYPHAKLDIILVVEAADTLTLDAIDALRLPARYRAVVAPHGRPRTKPRALNVALQFARGSLVVVYDAEDEPEPGQLRDAVAAFAADAGLACLQARLAIDNIEDSWLTRLFTLEYAALFHVINPGLAALRLPIPLGGTSNHFRAEALRRVNGWDAWNVTEDIDLGIRFARFGLRIGSLESNTYEEAPNTLNAWLKQRGRWMKGWMITLGTHSRAPVRLWRDLGLVSTLAVAAMLFGTIASCLLGPFCIAIMAVRAASGTLFRAPDAFDAWWNAVGCILMLLGVVSAVWPAMAGLRRRKLLGLSRWLVLYPVYLVLHALAAWQAAFEAFGRPHAWTKTEHGKAKRRLGSALPG